MPRTSSTLQAPCRHHSTSAPAGCHMHRLQPGTITKPTPRTHPNLRWHLPGSPRARCGVPKKATSNLEPC